MYKNFFLIILSVFFVIALMWKSPAVNTKSKRTLFECIHEENYDDATLKSLDHDFHIYYVKNAEQSCVNPNFPIIEISTPYQHNAWIQIIRMDSLNPRWGTFIDSSVGGENHYPLYSREISFFDSPLVAYSLITKPRKPWIAHAYAVTVDENKEIQEVIGGIEWGYKIDWFDFKPQMITPRALNQQDYEADLIIYLKQKNYSVE
jgi:hypothetical protein